MLLIDQPAWHWRGRLWSHLISDSSLDELHDFARSVGLRYASFGLDHYDVPEEMYLDVLAAGADEADARVLVRRLRETGLRRPGGKHLRTWQRSELVDAGMRAEVAAVADTLGDTVVVGVAGAVVNDPYVLERPGTTLVMFELWPDDNAAGVDRDVLRQIAPKATPVITRSRNGPLVVELVYGEY